MIVNGLGDFASDIGLPGGSLSIYDPGNVQDLAGLWCSITGYGCPVNPIFTAAETSGPGVPTDVSLASPNPSDAVTSSVVGNYENLQAANTDLINQAQAASDISLNGDTSPTVGGISLGIWAVIGVGVFLGVKLLKEFV